MKTLIHGGDVVAYADRDQFNGRARFNVVDDVA